jgi:hypothetical protein
MANERATLCAKNGYRHIAILSLIRRGDPLGRPFQKLPSNPGDPAGRPYGMLA